MHVINQLKPNWQLRIAIICACLAFCIRPAHADSLATELGVAGPQYYAVVTNSTDPHINGPGTSVGNLAVINSGASLHLDGSAPPSINGNVYLANGATIHAGSGQVTGSTSSLPNTGIYTAASDAAAYFGSLKPTNSISSITSTETITSSGAAATNVLDISNFSLGHDEVLTLSGGASDQFVINITGGLTLNSAEIVLSGGLLPTDVVFNIENGNLQTTGGLNNESVINGIVLAGPNTSIGMSPGQINGELISLTSGNFQIVSGGTVIDAPPAPSVPEPTTCFITAVGFIGLAGWRWRALRSSSHAKLPEDSVPARQT
jgi:hypothetical protein